MALGIDWSSLDAASHYVIRGDGFVINDYGHPSFIRYVEGNRVLTLSYRYVDETAQQGRRFFIFRTYAVHIQVPTNLTWDDDTALTTAEGAMVLNRICRTLGQYKKKLCRASLNDSLYEHLAKIDHQTRG